MAIEIKQLLIKSTVVDEKGKQMQVEQNNHQQQLRKELLAECRRLMTEMLSDKGER